MKKILSLILFCSLFIVACTKDIPKEVGNTSSSQERLSRNVHILTDKSWSGRRAGSRGEAKAALYLATYFYEYGLKPAGEQNTFFQTFPIATYDTVLNNGRMTFRKVNHKEAGFSENILGILPGQETGTIIVSAHYDHLGLIEDKLYPGANDNASGVSIILELIHQLKEQVPHYNILFALWGAEEMGLLGSAYFCENPTIPLEDIVCVINLDSIGNLKENKNILVWPSTQNKSENYFQQLLNDSWQITWEDSYKHNSDHYSFTKRGITGFTLLSPYWLENNHTPYDTMNKINIEMMSELLISLKKILISLD